MVGQIEAFVRFAVEAGTIAVEPAEEVAVESTVALVVAEIVELIF